MGEPFRDEMNAAMLRVDQLAEQNAELREELERLRKTAGEVKARSPDDPLAEQTLRVLQQLDVASLRRPPVQDDAVAPLAERPREPVRAALPLQTIATAPLDAPHLPTRADPPGWRGRAVLIACALSAGAGALLEWLVSGR